MHHPDTLSNKYHEQKFCIKFASQCSIEQKYLSQNVKKFKLKIKNKQISVQNFSTESAKLQNQQFITCYSSLHFILLKMTNNKHLRWVISTNQSCSRFVTHFDDKPKILTYRQISPNIFFPEKVSYENKSQSRRHRPTKEGSSINKVKWVWQQLRTVMLWEFLLLYISLPKVIPETESIQLVCYWK